MIGTMGKSRLLEMGGQNLSILFTELLKDTPVQIFNDAIELSYMANRIKG